MRGQAPVARAAPPPVSAWSALPFGLTAREAKMLLLVAEGLSDAQVAGRLFLSPFTVKAHLRTVYGKRGVPRALPPAVSPPRFCRVVR